METESDDLIIMEEKISIHQKKYRASFKECLVIGHRFEDQVGAYLGTQGLAYQLRADSIPYKFPDGRDVRLWDMPVICLKYKRVFNFEIKDFGRCYAYEATGLPKGYIDERISLSDGGKNVIIVMRDNMEVVEGIAKYRHCSTEDVILQMKNKGLVIETEKGVRFVPYGNNLYHLMKEENRDHIAEKNVPSRFKKDPQGQYMWKLSGFLLLPDLVKAIVENPNYPYDKASKQ